MAYVAQIHMNDGYVFNRNFATITECRNFAEEYGHSASSCSILRKTRAAPYPCIARHVRDTNGDGLRWFKA